MWKVARWLHTTLHSLCLSYPSRTSGQLQRTIPKQTSVLFRFCLFGVGKRTRMSACGRPTIRAPNAVDPSQNMSGCVLLRHFIEHFMDGRRWSQRGAPAPPASSPPRLHPPSKLARTPSFFLAHALHASPAPVPLAARRAMPPATPGLQVPRRLCPTAHTPGRSPAATATLAQPCPAARPWLSAACSPTPAGPRSSAAAG